MAPGRTLRAGLLLLVAAVCAIFGCGLPDAVPELDPPLDPRTSGVQEQFTFAAPASIGSPFQGIEIYYRFAGVGSRSESGLESRGDLLQAGFRRVASGTDDDPPSLPLIDRPAAGVVVTLDFSGVGIGTDPVATYDGQGGSARQVSLRRAVRGDDGRYKRFACGEFAGGDGDYAAVEAELGDTENCEPVQLQLYALSYGSTDRITVYSDALNLQTVDLTFRRR